MWGDGGFGTAGGTGLGTANGTDCVCMCMSAQNIYNSIHSIITVPDEDGRSTPSSDRFIPEKRTRCPFHKSLSGSQGWSGLVRSIVVHAS